MKVVNEISNITYSFPTGFHNALCNSYGREKKPIIDLLCDSDYYKLVMSWAKLKASGLVLTPNVSLVLISIFDFMTG